MKFGKVLQQSMQMSSSAWEAHWVDYKLLKKIIKDCAQLDKDDKLQTKIKPSIKPDNDSIRKSPDEENFFRTLRTQIKNISDFFLKEQAKYTSQVAAIEESFTQLKLSPKPEAKTELMKSCVTLYKELLLLENFAVMNFCGISKILKKHDKWTGYATRQKFMHTILMKQPFATYVPLLQMIDRLEHIFMEATGTSIEQHDAQKSSRRGNNNSGGGQHHPPSAGRSPSSGNMANGSSPRPYDQQTQPPDGLPPPAGGAAGGTEDSGSLSGRELSPRSDTDSVTLVKVHALRDDAWQLKKLESVGDYDGDDDDDGEDDGQDDGRFQPDDYDEQKETQDRQHQINPKVSLPLPLPKTTIMGGGAKETHSDSDAAAIAMLSMKDSAGSNRDQRVGFSSDGGDSSASEGSRMRYKRKAYAPLANISGGKRKMSFTTILN